MLEQTSWMQTITGFRYRYRYRHIINIDIPSCILIRYRFTNEPGLPYSIETIGLPRLAR